MSRSRRREQVGRRAAARVQVAEAPVARVRLDHRVERAEPDPAVGPEVHLAVVGGDEQARRRRAARRAPRRRAGRRPRARPGRTAPRARTRARPRRRPGSTRTRTARRRRRARARARRATAVVCQPWNSAPRRCTPVNPRGAELRLGDDGDRAPAEHGLALHVRGVGRPLAVGLLPADGVEHAARRRRMRKPVIPWRDGREPGGDRRERGRRGRRHDGGDRPAGAARASSGRHVRVTRPSASQPRPSSTSSTTARAPATGSGSQSTGRTPEERGHHTRSRSGPNSRASRGSTIRG